MSVGHYENFPVGSLVLPRRLRKPVHAVYAFARTADDMADEGSMPSEARLSGLEGLRRELDVLASGGRSAHPLIARLDAEAVVPFGLDLQPFYDLLSAFSQDVVKTRYAHFGDLTDYCRMFRQPCRTHYAGFIRENGCGVRSAKRRYLYGFATGEFLAGCSCGLAKGQGLYPAGRFVEIRCF